MESSESLRSFSLLYRDLTKVINGYQAYSDLIIDLRGQGQALGPTFKDIAARPELENKLLERFGSLGPTLVCPRNEINISWLDVLRGGLEDDDLKYQGDGTYWCSLQGVWIVLTHEHRDAILDDAVQQLIQPRVYSTKELELRTRYRLEDILIEGKSQAERRERRPSEY